MPNISIALIRQSNKMLSTDEGKNVTQYSAGLSQEAINNMLKEAFLRLRSAR